MTTRPSRRKSARRASTWARALLGPAATIGISVHNAREAREAEEGGADYLGAGAVFPTATKADATLVCPTTLADITAAVHIPVVAIGGITLENLEQLKGKGISGIALVSAIFGSEDIEARVRALSAATENL